MKRVVVSAALVALFGTCGFAYEEVQPTVINLNAPEYAGHGEIGHEHLESDVYFVAKGMVLLGNTIEHEEAELEGDVDLGFGLDVGYRLGEGFAVEYDFSYGASTVTKTEGTRKSEATGKYYTSTLDVVYVYEMTEQLGVFGKVGYEIEWEKICAYGIDSNDHGLVFGAGFEWAMDEEYKLLVEYEHSTIEAPRGDSLFVGVMYNFL